MCQPEFCKKLLRQLKEQGIHTAMNDGEIDGIAELLAGLEQLTKVRVLPYHQYAEDKYAALGMQYDMPDSLMPETEETEAALQCLRAHGLRAE